MELRWKVGREDAGRLLRLRSEQGARTFVTERIRKNLTHRPTAVPANTECWEIHLGCLLTTQQRSGPDSPIQKFLGLRPFPLALQKCRTATACDVFVLDTLTKFGGIRRTKTTAQCAAFNLNYFEPGGWEKLRKELNQLIGQPDRDAERQVAHFVSEHLRGFGPKQSRNFLQWLGLSRFEIPLDSRLVRWLNACGFLIRLSGQGLSDPAYYEFVLDGIQEMCAAADMFPCEFDALVFASYDDKEWRVNNRL